LKFINSKEPVLNKIILQSDKLEMKTIIKSISIINSSEIKYKQSKNKRLHIEFCLLDIAEKLSNSKKKTKIIKQSFEEENITNNASFSETNENQNLKKPNKIELKNKDASENKNVSGLSLSSIKFKKENEKIQLEKQQSSEKKKLNEIFTKKDLIDVWNSYLQDKLKNGDKNIASILKINTPSIENKNLINFSVLNDSNKIELEEEKTNLLLFLRKHLKNDEINLKITVNKLDIKKTEYSDKEKYKILLKKNSQLDILRTTFDLEF